MSEVSKIAAKLPFMSESFLADVVFLLRLMQNNYYKRLLENISPNTGEVWDEIEHAVTAVIRADRAFHIALALKEQQKQQEAAQTQGATSND